MRHDEIIAATNRLREMRMDFLCSENFRFRGSNDEGKFATLAVNDALDLLSQALNALKRAAVHNARAVQYEIDHQNGKV